MDKKVIDFFENLIKRFYDEDESFKSFVDEESANDYKTGFARDSEFGIDGFCMTIYTGSERRTFVIDGEDYYDPEGYTANYVVKMAYNWGYLGDGEQFYNEEKVYAMAKECGYNALFTETARGRPLTEIFGINARTSARLWVAERVEVDEEYNSDCLEEYISSDMLEWYADDMFCKKYDELTETEKNEVIVEYMDENATNEDAFWEIVKAYFPWYEKEHKLYSLIEAIGDMHTGNYGYANGKPKIVDYGWYQIGRTDAGHFFRYLYD